MKIKKSEAKKYEYTKDCIVREFEFPCKHFNFALAEIHGRFPKEGYYLNEVCEEVYYIVSGEGYIDYDGNRYNLNKGDAFYLAPNKKFAVFGKKIVIALPCAPPFDPKQHKHVE